MITTIAGAEHPAWCSRTHCTANPPQGRLHQSRPAQVHSPHTDLTAIVQIQQYVPAGADAGTGHPLIAVTIEYPSYGPDHPADDVQLCLDAEFAHAIGQLLVRTSRHASQER
jgi:hypothetical protein